VQTVSADPSAQQVLTEEPTLDVVALLAMAPKSTLTYYALAGSTDGSLDGSSFYDGLTEMLQGTALPQVVSFSYAGPETGHDPAIDDLLQELWAAGVVVAASSGDTGAAAQEGGPIGVMWPASYPTVVGVGGTAFQPGGASGAPQEVAWTYSGGGFSSVYPASVEQAEATEQSKRAVPDMAMYAAGIPLFYKGMEETVLGTSLAAPLWAGIYADLAGALPALAQTPPQLWINALGVGALHHAWTTAPFHDITQGDNILTSGPDAGKGYHAEPGFDEVTGWGSFDASATRAVLAQMPADSLQLNVQPSVPAAHQVQLTLTVTAQGLPVPGAAVQLRLPDGRPLPQDAWVQPPSVPATTDETGQWEATLAIDKLSDQVGHLEIQAQQGIFAGTTSVSLHPIATDTVGGADRYATSIALLSDPTIGWTSGPSNQVILVNGRPGHEVDALAANSLAGALHAPVMVVDGNASSLTAPQKQFVSKLGANQVLVVGLPLGDALYQQLKQMDLNVDEKTFHGDNRYDTANRVAEYIYGQTNASPKAVFVARGDALPDALSVGSLAAGEADIVLLQGPNDANWQETVTLAKRFGVPIYVLGGPKVVPNAVQQALGADRIYGSDRYETNLELLYWPKWSTAFRYDTLYITNGAPGHEVDALSAGSVAGQKSSPILLVNGSSLTEDQKTFLSDNTGKVQRVVFVGGNAVFAPGLADQVSTLLQGP
ncbi:MAG: cell wall-binding repeat-containing protein, partial [Firmicutes bacterium]|nr:cell wall-binding repeat-containing protein [Bacillota bacterium]